MTSKNPKKGWLTVRLIGVKDSTHVQTDGYLNIVLHGGFFWVYFGLLWYMFVKWVVMLQVDVEIATPEIIVSVYLLLFVPLAMAWAYFVHYGCKETQKNYHGKNHPETVGLWMVCGFFMDGFMDGFWMVYGWLMDGIWFMDC